MIYRFRLSQWQLFLLLLTVDFCMTPFGFTTLYSLLQRHVWVAILAQFGVTLTGTAGVVLMLRRFPGQPIQSIARQVIGPVLGWIYLLLLGLYLLFWGPVGNMIIVLRITQSLIAPVVAPYLISASIILVAGYAAYFGPEVIARVTEVLAFTFLPILVVISLVPYLNADLGRILPLSGLNIGALFDPEFWSFAIGMRGFILLLALAEAVPDKGRVALPALLSGVGSALVIFLIMLLPVALFGPEMLVRLHFPVLEAMDTVEATAVGIQSFQAVTVILWYVISFVVVSSMLFASSKVLGSTFALSSHRKLMPWLMAGSAWIAAIPFTPNETAVLRHIWSLLGYIVGLGGPWLLLALAALRGVGGSSVDE